MDRRFLAVILAVLACSLASGTMAFSSTDEVGEGVYLAPADTPNGERYADIVDDELVVEMRGFNVDSEVIIDDVFVIGFTGDDSKDSDQEATVWLEYDRDPVTLVRMDTGEPVEGETDTISLEPNETVVIGATVDAGDSGIVLESITLRGNVEKLDPQPPEPPKDPKDPKDPKEPKPPKETDDPKEPSKDSKDPEETKCPKDSSKAPEDPKDSAKETDCPDDSSKDSETSKDLEESKEAAIEPEKPEKPSKETDTPEEAEEQSKDLADYSSPCERFGVSLSAVGICWYWWVGANAAFAGFVAAIARLWSPTSNSFATDRHLRGSDRRKGLHDQSRSAVFVGLTAGIGVGSISLIVILALERLGLEGVAVFIPLLLAAGGVGAVIGARARSSPLIVHRRSEFESTAESKQDDEESP